ncbi:hypothetical protein [Thermomonospora cellulosilytica]|uniref:Uncharacterized protein n=1 Tax=Thermomonospora cellulosilytica TaxID=1411118 RepID=A0A7W3R6V2_9ACTN|nr:hypothetical protein [Thermomonospora cellulosilytica]MBA9001710.1 hypothetical protein [Thermomonospora cellulosilytica]
MLKRLATAGVLTVAVGGVLMSATPALAGGHDNYYKYDNDKKFDLDFKSFEKDIDVDNETIAILNCVNLVGGVLGTVDQNCFIGNTQSDGHNGDD